MGTFWKYDRVFISSFKNFNTFYNNYNCSGYLLFNKACFTINKDGEINGSVFYINIFIYFFIWFNSLEHDKKMSIELYTGFVGSGKSYCATALGVQVADA